MRRGSAAILGWSAAALICVGLVFSLVQIVRDAEREIRDVKLRAIEACADVPGRGYAGCFKQKLDEIAARKARARN